MCPLSQNEIQLPRGKPVRYDSEINFKFRPKVSEKTHW